MKTRDRILESACRAFAERGFRETTISDICRAAQANIAAVNYYFGSKEKLYEAVKGNKDLVDAIDRLLDQLAEAWPPEKGGE